jgi:DNA-binding MarR family transcriptional regulator
MRKEKLTERQREMIKELKRLGGEGALYKELAGAVPCKFGWMYLGPTHCSALRRVAGQLEKKGYVVVFQGERGETRVRLTEKGKKIEV